MTDTNELRKLLEKATPRPWRDADGILACPEGIYCIVWPTVDGVCQWRQNDLRIVIAAVNALPSLIAELDALRARVAVLERVRAAAEVAMSDLLPMVRGAKHFVTVRELVAALNAAKEAPDA